ncbi:MAG: glycosyltransferase family 39 protein [Candidatus Xenobia bacterium]
MARTRLAVVAVIALTLGLRLFHLGDPSLWTDEAGTFEIARSPLPRLMDIVRADCHPPGYFLFMAGWLRVAGQSDGVARLPSALASTLSVLLLMGLLWRLAGARAALVAGLLAGCSANLIFYGQELRMYPAVAMLGVLSCILFLEASERMEVRWWAGYSATLAAMAWLHYLGPLIALAHGSEALLGKRPAFKPWAISLGAAAATMIPWLPTFWYQTTHTTQGMGGTVPGFGEVMQTLGRTLIGCTLPLSDTATAWVGVLTLLLATVAVRQQRFLGLCTFVPMGAMLLLALVFRKPVFQDKVVLTSLTVFWGLLAQARISFKALVLVPLIGVNLWGTFNHAVIPDYHVEEMRPVVQYLNAQERPGDALILVSRGAYWPFAHYNRGHLQPNSVTGAEVPDKMEQIAGSAPRVWLLLAMPQVDDPHAAVLHWLQERYKLTGHLAVPGLIPVHLLEFEKR